MSVLNPCENQARPDEENPEFLSKQLITYLGNKRALLGIIDLAVTEVKRRLGKNKLRAFDAFSGSGIVSRFLKAHASYLASNDLEDYSAVIGRCYLRNRNDVDWQQLETLIDEINENVSQSTEYSGFIEELYSPRDEARITAGERVFYTPENARRLDRYRQLISMAPESLKDLLLGPLLSKASIHANTAGVFKGFYKNRQTRIGQFGGTGSDALNRIKGRITLEVPVLSKFECEHEVLQHDANTVARQLKNLDLAYVDPPYNQHPYGSNYFMLNLLVNYQRPPRVSRVSGIPPDWRRSGYNVRRQSLPLLRELLENIDARFLLVSFNNEGFVLPEAMDDLLQQLGSVKTYKTQYNAFRGSRNLDKRAMHVTEQLFLVDRAGKPESWRSHAIPRALENPKHSNGVPGSVGSGTAR